MSLKMKLLYAAFVFIGLGSLVQGKVLKDFKIICSQFFVNKQTPIFNSKSIEPNDKETDRYHFICQTQNPKPRIEDYEYVTLYDTVNKIPVYSAYKFYRRDPGRRIYRDGTWNIEPQLDDEDKLANMSREANSGVDVGLRGMFQALNKDYEGSHYDKGHLYPVSHAHTQEAADGTFTLTNAAPQKCDFNKSWYNEVESKVSSKLKGCPYDKAYVVTGVIPSKEPKMKGRVNVPAYFWTAYCCKGIFSGSFIMSADDLKAVEVSEEFKIETNFIQPFGGKCH